MKLRKLFIIGTILLGLSSLGALHCNVHASSYFSSDARRATYTRRSYVHKPIKLERLNNSSVFANVQSVGSKWLYKNEAVGIVPFYHMGHDGYIIHIPGKSAIYYAPTNSHSWFGKKIVKHHKTVKQNHKSKRARQINYEWSHAPKYIHAHFIRTNNKRLLKKSGFDYQSSSNGKYPYIISNYLPNSRKAYISKNVKFSTNKPYETGWLSNYLTYEYVGHNTWKF